MKNNYFIKGIILLLSSQVLIKLFGIIYTLYLTNKSCFGDEGNAIYLSSYQIYALILTFSSIGIPNAVSKIVAEKFENKDYLNIDRIIKISIVIFGLVGIIGSSILIIGSNFISNKILEIPYTKYSFMFLAPSVICVSLASVFKGYFNGISKIDITAKNQFIEQLFKCVLTIGFIEIASHFTNDIEILASIANLATSISCILSFLLIYIEYKKVKEKNLIININKKERISFIIKDILSISIPMTITIIISSLNKNIDSITVVKILKNIIGEKEALNQYGILVSKIDIFSNLPLSLNSSIVASLIPEIARYKNKDIASKIKFAILISLIIAIPYTFALYTYAENIILLLYSNAKDGVELLRFSSYNIVFLILVQTIFGILQGLGKNKIPLFSSIICIFIKYIVNINFIKINGIFVKGALIGNLTSNIVCFLILTIYLIFYIRKNIFDFKNIFYVIKYSIIMIFLSNILFNVFKIWINNNILFVIIIVISVVFYSFFIKKLKFFNNL